MRVLVIQIPTQTAEDVLTRLEKHIELAGTLLIDPLDIALHIPLGVSSAENGDLSLEQLWEGLLPLSRAGGVTQTRVEEHEAIEVGIEGLEVVGLVHSVEVVNVGGDLHLATQAVLNNSTEGIRWCALWQRVFGVAVGHALGTDENQVQQGAGEHVLELQPHFARQRRFRTGTQDEQSDWRGLQAQTFHVNIFTGTGRVQRVSESYT